MNIVKYDPFGDLRNLQDEVNRLFSGTFSRGSQDEVFVRRVVAERRYF